MNRKERRSAGVRGIAQARHDVVELAYIHPGDVSAAFMSSVLRLRDYELMRTQQLLGVRERRARAGSIARARNQLTTMFLRGKADWLFMADADMGFPPDAVHKMLANADPNERPLIGGLCFAHRTEGFDEETNAEYFGHIPTLSVWDRDEDDTIVGFKTIVVYPKDTLVEVDSTGAAFLLIHRSVFERMQEKFGETWWTNIPFPAKKDVFGEDTSFFLRCTEMGVPLYVHTGVRTSHDKGGIMLNEQTYEMQQLTRERLKDEIEFAPQ